MMLERPALRLDVRVHRAVLVHELAAGTAPTRSRRHWLCAEQLLTRPRREELARGLERLIDAADRPGARLSAAIPPQRNQIRDARGALSAIVGALHGTGPVGVQGVAIVAELLADGGSPAFAPSPPGALSELAQRALEALAVPASATELAMPV